MVPPHMPRISREQVALHRTLLEAATVEDLDELLLDLLKKSHPTKVSQDN